MGNNLFCKDCMGISESLKVYRGNYFTNKGNKPYKVSFLRLDSVEYGYGLVGSFGKNALIPTRLLNNNQKAEASQWKEKEER